MTLALCVHLSSAPLLSQDNALTRSLVGFRGALKCAPTEAVYIEGWSAVFAIPIARNKNVRTITVHSTGNFLLFCFVQYFSKFCNLPVHVSELKL